MANCCVVGTLNIGGGGGTSLTGLSDIMKIDIGPWNMDTTNSLFVPDGSPLITSSTIRSVEVYIRNDLQTQLRRLDIVAGPVNGSWNYNGSGFNLIRVTGGFFDSVDYDDGVINRGYIMVGIKL